MRRVALFVLSLGFVYFGTAAENNFLLKINLPKPASPYMEGSKWFEEIKVVAKDEGWQGSDYKLYIERYNNIEEVGRRYFDNQTESLISVDQLQQEYRTVLEFLAPAHGETSYYIAPEEGKDPHYSEVEIIWDTDHRLYCNNSEKGKGIGVPLTRETQDILIDGPLYLVTEDDLKKAWDRAHDRGLDQDVQNQMEWVEKISENRNPEKWKTFVDRCREEYWPSPGDGDEVDWSSNGTEEYDVEDEVDWGYDEESNVPPQTEPPFVGPEVPKQAEVIIWNRTGKTIRLISSKKTMDPLVLSSGGEERVSANAYDKWCYTDAEKPDCRSCWFSLPEENESESLPIFSKERKCRLDLTVKSASSSFVAIELEQEGCGVLSWKEGNPPPMVYAHRDMKIAVPPGYEVSPSTISGSLFHEGGVCRKTITLKKTKPTEIKSEIDENHGAKGEELRKKEKSSPASRAQTDDKADMYDLLEAFKKYADNKPTRKAKFKQNVYEFQNIGDTMLGDTARKFRAVMEKRKMSKEQYLDWAVKNGLSKDFADYLRK